MSRSSRPSPSWPAAAAGLLVAGMAAASSNTVVVPGTADVWLAGQPDGTILAGGFPSDDAAPAESPVLASSGLYMVAGSHLTFTVTGSVDYGGCACATPDGGEPCGTFSTGEFFGISIYTGPINALIGVFVDASVPGGTAPSGIDFSTLASQAQPSISPLLNQVFFIGDGLTGTGSGAIQQVVIPAGAERLFLGSSDGPGANYNNSGGFDVTVTDVDPCLHRSDVTGLDPHVPAREVVFLVPRTAQDVALRGVAYQCPFAPGDLEPEVNALGNGIPLSLYQVNRPLSTLRLTKSGTTIRFEF